jgi:hypothetical protein
MLPLSALAFLGTYKLDDFIKLRLFNLIIMAEPIERRSNRSRKPKVPFGEQYAQSSVPSEPSRAPKAKPVKSATKSTKKPHHAYKIAIISKTWSKKDDSAHLEFRRLYTRSY